MKIFITLILFFGIFASPAIAQISIKDGRIIEKSGNDFIMRGINHGHTWSKDKTKNVLINVSKTKSNTIRIALSNGKIWDKSTKAEVQEIIKQAKLLNLILILEVHDTTGHEPINRDENYKSSTILEAAQYWLEIKDLLIGQEDFVILNIGNEPSGNGENANLYWFEQHKEAIAILRAAGIKNTIMIDGANWGQESSLTMAKTAPELFASDPLKNLIFSVHMYQVYNSPEKVKNYIDIYINNKLPLIIGEFGPDHQGDAVDEQTIFDYSHEKGIGWLGWSWSGNSEIAANLDIVQDYNPKKLSPWGEQIINGPTGIKQSSKIASIYTRQPVYKKVWKIILRTKHKISKANTSSIIQ